MVVVSPLVFMIKLMMLHFKNYCETKYGKVEKLCHFSTHDMTMFYLTFHQIQIIFIGKALTHLDVNFFIVIKLDQLH